MINSIPKTMSKLPLDDRKRPIPWFVAMIEGKPDFRIADGRKAVLAVTEKRCWICGEKLESRKVFVIGPIASITRVHGEPPCHSECAKYAAMACPFLTKPKVNRRESNMPEGTFVPGEGINRNPGVCLLWYCSSFELFAVENGGRLFSIGNPSKVEWFAEGRKATHTEIMESFESGLPYVRQHAIDRGVKDASIVEKMIECARRLIPKK